MKLDAPVSRAPSSEGLIGDAPITGGAPAWGPPMDDTPSHQWVIFPLVVLQLVMLPSEVFPFTWWCSHPQCSHQ